MDGSFSLFNAQLEGAASLRVHYSWPLSLGNLQTLIEYY